MLRQLKHMRQYYFVYNDEYAYGKLCSFRLNWKWLKSTTHFGILGKPDENQDQQNIIMLINLI